MTATPETTIREIVATDYRTAAIFQRHGLDFCCNGCRTIEQGCRDAGADAGAVIRDIAAVLDTPASGVPRFAAWDARTLIAYIVANHHAYVREALPPLLRHTSKVADVHGERHPELVHVAALFARVADEMLEHMTKEEQVLFPFIAALEEARLDATAPPPAPFGTVANPIRMMESEHRFVGDAMAEIRHVTDNYRPPSHACATYRVSFQELEAFERDLHDHVHLENNLLFPKAAALETRS
jgi:regulator of cell morphogenesis and NO signaling